MSLSVVSPVFEEQWRWQGWTNDQDHASGGAIDTFGNVLLVGRTSEDQLNTVNDDTFTSTVNSDFVAVKLQETTGNVLWTWEDTSLDGTDWMVAAGTDSTNNAVFGGFTNGDWNATNAGGLRDVAAVKLHGDSGDELWRYQSIAPDSSQSDSVGFNVSYVSAVSVDGDDNVLLVGSTFNSLEEEGNLHYLAIKLLGETGDEVWRVHGGSASARQGFEGAQVDSFGDLIAAGFTEEESGGTSHPLVVKMSGVDGTQQWQYTSSDFGTKLLSVAVDDRDNVFVAGVENDGPAVRKIDGLTGELMWAYRGDHESRTVFNDIAIDGGTDWVVAVGFTEGTWVESLSDANQARGGDDFAAVVLDGDGGDELARYQNGTSERDRLEFVAFDNDGGLFAGGYSKGAWSAGSDSLDFVGVKFAPLPHELMQTSPPTPAPVIAPTSSGVTSPAPSPATATPAPFVSAMTPAPVEAGRDVPLPVASPAPMANVNTTTAAAAAESSSLAPGSVAGITIGGLCFLVFVAVCACRGKMNAAAARAFYRSKRVGPVGRRRAQQADDFVVQPEL